jgi:hypothetical protein
VDGRSPSKEVPVAHVELSLSEPFVPPPEDGPDPGGALGRWAAAAAEADEPCMVIDAYSAIVALSRSACTLLGFRDQESAVHRHLFGGVLRLLDFTANPTALADGDLEKIPPILAFSSGRLARGLIRAQSGGEIRTLDAIATPLLDGDQVVGSLTFFSQI